MVSTVFTLQPKCSAIRRIGGCSTLYSRRNSAISTSPAGLIALASASHRLTTPGDTPKRAASARPDTFSSR
ncbi:hypothetical protein [Catenulispora pinisilvae]|uniref:hypothetical protein n=1 Tax=Catenulispora pinisilvae TaxID=2705253 RepID=UPI001892610B|nr:hypothetical protein [Catenulispora pinisilvae]